jgi:UDP-N-acetylmuramate--alanine ligase
VTARRLLDQVTHVHLVGIGGIGLSAIARVLHGTGYVVSGSDAQDSMLLGILESEGITVHRGHDAQNVTGADLVVMSSAVPESNVEVAAARQAGVPVVKRAQLLGEMMEGKFGIAVAGTHGKTTTSALIAFMLTELELDPTFIVGGILADTGANARSGRGPHFVIEADEYDRMFLGLRSRLAVITVIEMDHPDCFDDIEDMTQAFDRFARSLPDGGTLIGCIDLPRVSDLLRDVGRDCAIDIITYGLRHGQWQARDITTNAVGGSDFAVLYHGQTVGHGRLRLPGLHNVSNALAALATMHRLDLDMEQVLRVLPRFHGVLRRFEVKGEAEGIVVIDDYAHHPTEIRATLAAARRRYPNRQVWAFFQPHTFSRTKSLLDDFAASFGDADHVVVGEIYAARETDDLGVSSLDLVQRMAHPDVRHAATLQDAIAYLCRALHPGDVLLTLGAGNGYQVGEAVLRTLAQKDMARCA